MTGESFSLAEHLEENHAGSSAKYIKNIVYGGLDGIITTFSIIAAAFGASLEMETIITMGVANLVADGISMGLGDYISSSSENKYILSEKEKEEHEYEVNHDYEKEELVELFTKDGLEKEDSTKIVDILASKIEYKPIFIKYMLQLELGLDIPDNNPAKEGLVTFISFIIFGFVPVFFYIMFYVGNYDNNNTIFGIIYLISGITMFGLGAVNAYLTKQKWLRGGLMMMFNGLLAATCALGIGYGIEKMFD